MIALGSNVKNTKADLALFLQKANCHHIADLGGKVLKARKFVQRRHWETSIWKSKAGNNPANCNHGKRRFQYVSAPLSDELTHLVHTISHRIARFLERQGLLERDMEQSYLILEEDDDPMSQMHRHSITYRIAVGAQQGQKSLPCKPCHRVTMKAMKHRLDK